VLVVGIVAAVVAGSAFAIAAVVRSRRTAQAPGSAAPTVPRVAVPVAVPSEERDAAADGGPVAVDELRSIDGIGTETSKRLRSLGITSIEQIAAWSPQDVRSIAAQIELDVERIEREDWVGQAQDASGITTGAA
jgi:predicted flap endonuclease-1-like 5' DNA nuclease